MCSFCEMWLSVSQISGCHLFPFLWASHPRTSSFEPVSGSPWSSAPTHPVGGFWVSKASEKIPSLLEELGLQQPQSLLEKVAGPNPILLLPPLIRNMTVSKLFYLWNTVCRYGRHLLIHLAERNIKGSFQKTRNSPDKGYTHYKRRNYSQMKICPRLINVLSNRSIICGAGERIDHLSSFVLEIDILVSFN